jgi:hypothetical protein
MDIFFPIFSGEVDHFGKEEVRGMGNIMGFGKTTHDIRSELSRGQFHHIKGG